jgi:penicillin-binding protein 2
MLLHPTMLKFRPFHGLLAAAITGGPLLPAQDLPSKELASVAPPGGKSASEGSIQSRKDARTITLKIPAPRGQIVDREGNPFAQNEVAYQVALQYKQFEVADQDFVVNWGRQRLDVLQGLVKNPLNKTDAELYDHYRHRRWLPLLVSGQMTAKEAKAIEPKLTAGMTLQAVYRRHYPGGDSAAHVVGYTGSVGKLPTGPINFNEPLWEESEGRAGLEKLFDKELTGEAAMKKLLFDESGAKLQEEQIGRPKPGGTVVTTLNLKWQKLAEEVLRKGCKRGALVVIDVATGEVLVMASRPSFDLNKFIPGISEADYTALNDDPAAPLHGRAFQSLYPPASTFKPLVALAALDNGVVTEHSTVYCPASIRIGNHVFHNHNKRAEGSINVKRAIARSTNPWFYQVGIDVGPSAFLDVARRLGMGSKTGLPLVGEAEGLVPNDDYMMRVHKRRILDGDTANMSIGQGDLLASPLQVAQAMAGIANGGALPKLQLVTQVQDTRGKVVRATLPERRNWLGTKPEAVEIVREGMRDVVNSGYGTGRSAGLSYTTLCGKTGTAQWGPTSKNQRLAWFAGFLPFDNPRYAFAVLYEGKPNEVVSGGRMAAPMVRNFFEPIKDDIKEIIAPPKKALVVVEEVEEAEESPEVQDAAEAPLINPDGTLVEAPRRALIVEEGEMNESPDDTPIRALPVGEDEDVDDAGVIE